MTEDDFKRTESMLARRIEVMEENIQHKFNLLIEVLVEGQQRLAERMDRMETVLQGADMQLPSLEGQRTRIEEKVDNVAADFSPHRAEAHQGVYRVREE